MENKYDIFISYRTDDTSERAEYLYKLLHQYNRKWNISYDRENLNGEWHIELIRRIDSSKNVIVLIGDETFNYNEKNLNDDVELYGYLSTASLDQIKQKIEEMQTQNRQPDYLRLEIARALKQADTTRIVPLILYKNKIFDLQDLLLPKDIAGLKNCQSVSYHNHKKNSMLFDSIIESVVEKLKKEDDNLIKRITRLIKKYILLICLIFIFGVVGLRYIEEVDKKQLLREIEHNTAVNNFKFASENVNIDNIFLCDTALYWLNKVDSIEFNKKEYNKLKFEFEKKVDSLYMLCDDRLKNTTTPNIIRGIAEKDRDSLVNVKKKL